MARAHKYYQHSGRFEPTGPVLMALLGAAGAVVLGTAYGPLIFINPFIYVSALGTVGFGIGVGYMVGLGARWGHVRSMAIVNVLAVCAALLANYAGWVSWIYALSEWEALIFSPKILIEVIQAVAKEGAWSIGSGDAPVTGIALYAIWLVEAALIIGACVWWARKTIMHLPFCETCKAWVTKAEALPKFAYLLGASKLTEQLENDDLSGLGELQLAERSTMRYSLVELLSCRACDKMHLLNIKNIMIAVDEKGKRSKTEDYIVQNLILPEEAYIALKTHGDNLKKEQSAAIAAKAQAKAPEQEGEAVEAIPEAPEVEAEKV
jgi:hypothetical protein